MSWEMMTDAQSLDRVFDRCVLWQSLQRLDGTLFLTDLHLQDSTIVSMTIGPAVGRMSLFSRVG
jgi:hypothetical protein